VVATFVGAEGAADAVQICQLSLWIKTATRGKQLTIPDHTIREGNRVISARRIGSWCAS
jgi:hypothetical protein